MRVSVNTQQIEFTYRPSIGLRLRHFFGHIEVTKIVFVYALILSILATAYSFSHNYIVAYGDAESHLNIAKRVASSITPGLSQLGGIWLPLPHLLMVPLVFFDPLWKTGLAGSIVSGIAFVIGSVYIYKTTFFITKNKVAGFISFLIFSFNPNILYLQTTPMTEMLLICFFILSTYYFILYLYNTTSVPNLVYAGMFAFAASISRYDGWFLVLFEAAILVAFLAVQRCKFKIIEGRTIMFSVLGFLGIFCWFLWDFLLLGDPFYFTDSEFSAKSQQKAWMNRGELPAYHNIITSLWYYLADSVVNIGEGISIIAALGLLYYLIHHFSFRKLCIITLLFVPFIFNVYTLYAGQSVIFLPQITPANFTWHLFNVRYGVLMVPAAAFLVGYLFYQVRLAGKILILLFFGLQLLSYATGLTQVISLADGVYGLSANKTNDVQGFLNKNYDGGMVLTDDFARTVSLVKSTIPIRNTIYVGNKPYWQESLHEPEKYARWIVMQKNDPIWKSIYENPPVRDRLFKYFQKVYTSPDILVFRRIKS